MDWLSAAGGFAVAAALWAAKEIFAPDALDRLSQARRDHYMRSAEQRQYAREDEPIRQQIAAAVRRLIKKLRQGIVVGPISLEEWQRLHDELVTFDSAEGARALGEDYGAFVDALEYDAFSIGYQRDRNEQWQEPDERWPKRAAFERRQERAHTAKNYATDMLRWVPVLTALGFEDANAFESMGNRQIFMSDNTFNEMPPIG